MVKMLTVLVSTITNSQIFLLKKCDIFCKSHFFSKHISVYAVFNDQSLNDTLTNDIVSFEQLGPDSRSNAVPLAQFFILCQSLQLCCYVLFYLFLISSSFGTLRRLRVVTALFLVGSFTFVCFS